MGFKFTLDNFRFEEDNIKLILDKCFLNPSGWLLCLNAIIKYLLNSMFDIFACL